MPILSLIWRYRKIAGAIFAILAMSVLAWRIAAWRSGYLKLDATIAALHKEQEGRQADRAAYTANIVQAEREAQALSADLAAIRARFAELGNVPPKTLIRTVEVPVNEGQTTCPDPRVSPGFVSVWNDSGKP